MMLVVLTITLVGLSWLLLCWRGWSAAQIPDDDRQSLNREQYQARVNQLETAQTAGTLSAEEVQRELASLQQQLLHAPAGERPGWKASLTAPLRIALLVVPLASAAAGFYLTNGVQHWPEETVSEAAAPDVEAMVQGLAARLEQDPNDPQGWVMLGRSYMVLQRYQEAARAWEQANARSAQPDADLLVAEAEALALSRDRDLEGRPERLLDRALQLDPVNIKGLWYSALAARSRGDMALADQRFEKLSSLPDLPPELREVLRDLGVDNAGVSQAQSEPAGYALDLTISLAPGLAATDAPGSILFVFARQPDGPPMPLAVQRLPMGEFPMQVRLDDSMSMMPGRLMSEQPELELVARVSAAGQAKASSGDWQGVTRWSNTASGGQITLLIDSVVP